MSGIEFIVSEHSKLLDQARDDAIADARRKAELYAKAAGAKLGRVVAITEEGAPTPPHPVHHARRRGSGGAGGTDAKGDRDGELRVGAVNTSFRGAGAGRQSAAPLAAGPESIIPALRLWISGSRPFGCAPE